MVGTYTIPDANGEPIVVRYTAGPNTGFVIENLDEVLERSRPQGSGEATGQSRPVAQTATAATRRTQTHTQSKKCPHVRLL